MTTFSKLYDGRLPTVHTSVTRAARPLTGWAYAVCAVYAGFVYCARSDVMQVDELVVYG